MKPADFVPIVYFQDNCPFCLKARPFLLESGAIENVEIREFTPGTAQEREIRGELAVKFDQVASPTAQMEPGKFIKGSDEIIEVVARVIGIDQQQLPGLPAYRQLMKYIMRLRSENVELNAKAAYALPQGFSSAQRSLSPPLLATNRPRRCRAPSNAGADPSSIDSMDLNYLLHRQQVERSRAKAAKSYAARKAHEELARHYEAQIEQLAGDTFMIRRGDERSD